MLGSVGRAAKLPIRAPFKAYHYKDRPQRWPSFNGHDIRSNGPQAITLSDAHVSHAETIRYIAGHLWPDDCKGKVQTSLSFALIAASKMAQGSSQRYLAKLMDILSDSEVLKNGDSEDWAEIMRTAFMLGLSRFLAVAFREVRGAIYSRVINRANRRIAAELFGALQTSDIDFLLHAKPGELTSSIINSSKALGSLLNNLNQRAIPMYWDISQMITKLSQLQNQTWMNDKVRRNRITAGPGSPPPANVVKLAQSTLLGYFLWSFLYGDYRVKERVAMNDSESKARGGMLESLQNAESVRAFNTGRQEVERFNRLYQAFEEDQVKVQQSLAIMNTVQQLILRGGVLASVMCMADQIFKGNAKMSALTSTMHLFDGLVHPLNFVGTMYRDFKTNYHDVRQGLRLLKIRNLQDRPGAQPLIINRGSIQFRNISFTYPSRLTRGSNPEDVDVQNDTRVLKNINLSIAGKSSVAIVGPSGSGKSTLLRLLLRLYEPNKGAVGICGQDINEVTLKSLRNSVSLVSQETLLFNSSLKENLMYGWSLPKKKIGRSLVVDEELVDKRLKEVIESCGLTELQEKLGLDGSCGERGSALSGGERQRVAVARAMLRQTPIVLLDEPTTGLDARNELLLLKAIEKLKGAATVVQVAHKLSTITNADEIIYIENGMIQERGTHEQLLARKGKYASTWSRQASNWQEEEKKEAAESSTVSTDSGCSSRSGCCHD